MGIVCLAWGPSGQWALSLSSKVSGFQCNFREGVQRLPSGRRASGGIPSKCCWLQWQMSLPSPSPASFPDFKIFSTTAMENKGVEILGSPKSFLRGSLGEKNFKYPLGSHSTLICVTDAPKRKAKKCRISLNVFFCSFSYSRWQLQISLDWHI